jgi:hypothetical protein
LWDGEKTTAGWAADRIGRWETFAPSRAATSVTTAFPIFALIPKTRVANCQKQMDAQYYVPGKKKFEELRPDDHYRWCEQALLVRQAPDGLFGHSSIFEQRDAGKAEG